MRRRDFIISSTGLAGLAAAPAWADMDDALLRRAFLFGYGPYEFARTALGGAARQGYRPNQLVRRRTLSDHTHRIVTAPNNDTLYASAFLDLSGGPLEVATPDAPDRYHNIAFMNLFTDNFAYLGTRTTGGRAGRWWVAGPDWRGRPPEGIGLIRSDTNDVWMLGRTLVSGPDDLAAANAVQDGITLTVPPGRTEPRPILSRPPLEPTGEAFLNTINEMLGRSRRQTGQARRGAAFRAAGVRPGAPGAFAALPAERRAAWDRLIPDVLKVLRGNAETGSRLVRGWRTPPAGVGDFGENDLLRSTIALWGLAALSIDEATYFRAAMDGAGERLNGAKAYSFTIPAAGVPVDAFWSLSMYEETPDGRFFFVDNPLRRYAVGDRTPGLTRNADGSLTILLQAEAPSGPLAANWLPAPRGPFMTSFRAYLPRPEMRDGRWTPPPIVPAPAV